MWEAASGLVDETTHHCLGAKAKDIQNHDSWHGQHDTSGHEFFQGFKVKSEKEKRCKVKGLGD